MGVRGFTVVKEMAEFWYTGCLFPYRFRLTVHDGLDADVYVVEFPVKLGEAVLLVVDEPLEAPESEATNSFWA